MNKNKMRIAVNALTISLLTALSLTLVGCDDKAAGNMRDLTPEEKLSETKREAEAGDAEAQFILGVMYAHGEGVPKDLAKAVEWWQKAAAQGNAAPQYNLGISYANGEGVLTDSAKAVEWWQKAAAQGDALAQFSLGWSYWYGNGVSRNHVLAYAWLNLSAAQGEDAARELRDLFEKELTSAQRAEGQNLATNWKKGELL